MRKKIKNDSLLNTALIDEIKEKGSLPDHLLAKLPEYVKKWVDIGHSTTPINHESLNKDLDAFYAICELDAPEKEYFPSPYALSNKMKEMGIKFSDIQYCYGCHDCSYLSFCDFFHSEGLVEDIENLDLLIRIAKNSFWFVPFEDKVYISEKPVEQHNIAENGRLHQDEGPAVKFADGYSLYSLNGVRFPLNDKSISFVLRRAEDIDPNEIFSIENVEERREVIRKIGIERLLSNLKYSSLDNNDDYDLLSVDLSINMDESDHEPDDLQDLKNAKYLKMLNPSIGIWHVEAVDPSCLTIQDALNYRRYGKDYRGKPTWNPSTLT